MEENTATLQTLVIAHACFGTSDEIAPTLERALAMEGPVVIGIPVDYRDNHLLMDIVHPNVLN